MRLLLDECCTSRLAAALRTAGLDLVMVRDRCPGASDVDVMALGFSEDRVVVTHDYDLPELAVRHRQPVIGLLLIQASLAILPEDIVRVAETVAREGDALLGRLTILERDRMRTRPL